VLCECRSEWSLNVMPYEIIKRVIQFVPLTYLVSVGKVCTLWKNIVLVVRRERHRVLLVSVLNSCPNKPNICNVTSVALQIEEEMFMKFGCLGKAYFNKLRTIKANLGRNHELSRSVLSGEITPNVLLQMSYEELAPKALQEQRRQIREDAKKAVILDTSFGSLVGKDSSFHYTTQFVCPKCDAREAVYYQWRTRADIEAGTIFVSCCKCNLRWEV